MNIDQISQGILAKFEKCRIVFWQDSDNEFIEQLDDLSLTEQSLGDIEVIRLDDFSHFEVKQRIELLEPETHFLLYSNKIPSEPVRDWLFDIRLYAQEFYADSSSMILNELGMQMEFRPVVAQYKSFFTSKQRTTRLKSLLPENANKEELEIALIAATLKVETATFLSVLQYLMLKLSSDFDKEDYFSELEKFNLIKPFWAFAKEELGYFVDSEVEANSSSEIHSYQHEESLNHEQQNKAQPRLQELAIKLLFTDCYQSLQNSGVSAKDDVLERFSSHLLPMLTQEQKHSIQERSSTNKSSAIAQYSANSAKRATAISFVSGWRNSRNFESYNKIAELIEREYEIKDKLSFIKSPFQLQSVDTFEFVEKRIIILLAEQLPTFEQAEVDALVSHRLLSHWCYTDKHSDSHNDKKYASILKAIKAAKKFYTLKYQYIDGFEFSSAKELYRAYETEIFQFDAAYREFCENANHVAQKGLDILKGTGLVSDIESLYVDWYLHDLAIAWGKHVDEDKLLDTWKLTGVSNQYNFYNNEVRSIFNTSQVKRVFVIISDALRYEVANEISEQVNDDPRFNAEIKSQLGVVPSYTQLGMAALLPHNKLTAHINSKVEYKADGTSVHGFDNRQKILAKHSGLAVKASDVLNWTNQEGRKKVENARVVYIYHDEIDATGDKLVSEDKTFDACRKAIGDIKSLIERILTRLNGTRIIVTADHGFLFKSSDVVDSDKTSLSAKPSGAVESKKRYVIGKNLPSDEYYWQGKMAITANISPNDSEIASENESSAEYIVPRGSNRFNFVGGAKFIHGGIMPQEICVPVLKVRLLKTDKQKSTLAKQKVSVVPLGSPIRLVSLTDKIQLLQTDPLSEQFKERELEIWIEDQNGSVVCNKQKVTFNSSSDKVEDRKRNVVISLKGSGFDRTSTYKLVFKDAEKNDHYASHSVIIDLAIEDDFF